MASTNLTHSTKNQLKGGQEASGGKLSPESNELFVSLPREKDWVSPYLYLFQNFWCSATIIQAIITFQKHFQAKDSDVVIASLPKSGTTWLKALTFAIINRHNFSNHPLLTSNPHELVPSFELSIYGDVHDKIPKSHPPNMSEPRLFGTHIPFPLLAKSIKDSKCRIIYICRNPFDNFVSFWVFINKINHGSLPTITLEEAFERYCEGKSTYGPFWNHILGYLKESIARPDKILFLKYEDLKEDIHFHVKRVAEFLGCPFTQEEESGGVIDNIIKLCSFEKMKELEVNKNGSLSSIRENNYYFRKAEIGDWRNHLSTSMVEKLSKIIEEKFSGSGLSFKLHY